MPDALPGENGVTATYRSSGQAKEASRRPWW